jgi:hypothetical protein
MSVPAVRAALEAALAAMQPPLATAWQNAPYTPVQGVPYQAVYLLPAEPDNPEMGGTYTQERGIMQVSLFYPLGKGPGEAEARANLIRNTFKRGAAFPAQGVTTIVEKTPEIAPGRTETDRFHIPVKVRFYADFIA